MEPRNVGREAVSAFSRESMGKVARGVLCVSMGSRGPMDGGMLAARRMAS